MYRKVILSIAIICLSGYSQKFETRLYGGITLPIGAEVGFISETELPNINALKLLTKGSLLWMPVFGNEEKTNSLLIAGLQPGLRLKLLNDVLLISGGLSLNPFYTIPFDGLDFGFGYFFGVAVRIKNSEIGLYSTNVHGREKFIREFNWVSFTISRAFSVIDKNDTGKSEKHTNG